MVNKKITVSIPEEVIVDTRKLAARQGATFSGILRVSLVEYLQKRKKKINKSYSLRE